MLQESGTLTAKNAVMKNSAKNRVKNSAEINPENSVKIDAENSANEIKSPLSVVLKASKRDVWMNRREALTLLAGGLIGTGAGCRGSGGDGRPSLRYMAWGTPEQLAVEQQLVDEFMKREPGIRVTLFKVPQSAYLQKMTIMLASRTAPDIVRVDHYNFPDLVRKGYFHDLTDLARADADFHADDFYPQCLEEGMHQGRLYGLSVLFGGIIVYYNRTLFAKAGAPDPFALSERGEWTFEAMLDAARRITQFDRTGRAKQFGMLMPGWPSYSPFIWGFGGNYLTPDGNHSALDQPDTIAGFQYLADLRYKEKVMPTPSQASLSAFTFETAKVGMACDFMGLAPRLWRTSKEMDWDIAPVPTGPRGGSTIVKGNQLVMYAECPHPEAAWKFMRFLTGPEAENLLYGTLRRCAPTRKAVATSATFLTPDPKKPPQNTRVYLSAVEKGRALPINARWAEWTQAQNSAMDDLWSGRERDAAVVCRRAAQKVNEVLASEEGY